MERGKRIPIHDHSGFNEGGRIHTPAIVQQLGGAEALSPSTTTTSAITVSEDGATVVSGAKSLDAGHGLDVTAPGALVAAFAVDESELTVESMGTAETDTSLVLSPDGAGGVAFASLPIGVPVLNVGARVYRTTTQSIPNSTYTAISFDGELFDTHGFHDGTNPTRLTIPTGLAGYYLIEALCVFNGGGGGSARISTVALNGTDFFLQAGSGTTSSTHVPQATVYYLDEGDYIELWAFQDSGGSFNVNVGGHSGNYAPHLGLYRLTSGTGIVVEDEDGAPSVVSPTTLKFSNGSVTDNGDGTVSIDVSGGGGGSITVKESDGSPSVNPVDTIAFSGATVTDDTGGQVTVTVTGSGSSLTVEEADGSPTDSAVTKIKFPNGSLSISSHVATYSPLGGAAGGGWDSIVAKASDDTVTNSATLANDSELLWSVGSGEVWRFELTAIYRTDATGDIKVAFAVSTGTPAWTYRYYGENVSSGFLSSGNRETGAGTTTAIPAGGGTTTIDRVLFVEGFLWNVGASATVNVKFAQNTATSGQSAILKTGSMLKLKRVI